MEKRGIFTNPPRKGEATTPGILFSSLKTDFKKGSVPKPEVQMRSRSAEKKDERFAFKPPSLLLDAPFQADQEVYGEDNKMLSALAEKSLEVISKNDYNNKKQKITTYFRFLRWQIIFIKIV